MRESMPLAVSQMGCVAGAFGDRPLRGEPSAEMAAK
jgi:hypothetical protein